MPPMPKPACELIRKADTEPAFQVTSPSQPMKPRGPDPIRAKWAAEPARTSFRPLQPLTFSFLLPGADVWAPTSVTLCR